jgi:hypothetical protein
MKALGRAGAQGLHWLDIEVAARAQPLSRTSFYTKDSATGGGIGHPAMGAFHLTYRGARSCLRHAQD